MYYNYSDKELDLMGIDSLRSLYKERERERNAAREEVTQLQIKLCKIERKENLLLSLENYERCIAGIKEELENL